MSQLRNQHVHYIAGRWLDGRDEELVSHNPASREVVWTGRSGTADEVGQAVDAARGAFPEWSALFVERRIAHLERFAATLKGDAADMALLISRETGKPLWESREEVAAMVAKVGISIQAHRERRSESVFDLSGVQAVTRYKPHGVVAVLGPFNFPGHLPNGHIVPALLAGNCVVFKPSEMGPGVAQRTIEHWAKAGLPAGVINLVQGARDTGAALAGHSGIDGLFFTGSFAAGRALSLALAPWPHKILALEMGGNNPLVVWPETDLASAAHAIVQSAFLTAGQRCSCARRLIIPQDRWGESLLKELRTRAQQLVVGAYDSDPEPYMGPVISPAAADRLLAVQEEMLREGGQAILMMKRLSQSRAMLTPGIIEVTEVNPRADVEHFGPLLQVIRVRHFDAAISEANNTAFGLVAGLICNERRLYDEFYRRARAGLINWNRPTTGASSRLPFGGIGQSGNHRPSGYWACDYCAYPVASLESESLSPPPKPARGDAP